MSFNSLSLPDSTWQGRNIPAQTALALVGLVVALNAGDAVALWHAWRTSYTYSHGIVVAPVILWLIWRQRAHLRFEGRVPLVSGALLLAALEIVWIAACGAHIDVVRYALMPCLIMASVLLLLGPESARRLAFPLGWFWCAVSVWDVLGGFLQRVTAVVDTFALSVLGMPVLRVGDSVTVPAGTFEIAASCSGLNFFVVAVTLAAFLGHVRQWTLPSRMVLIALAALVAMASNWVRVAVIIIAGQWTHMQTSLVTEGHYMFGWWLFAGVLAVFLFFASRRDQAAPAPASPIAVSAPIRGAIAVRLAIIMPLLLAGPAWAAWQDHDAASRLLQVRLPAGRGLWTGPAAADGAWRPAFAGASASARGRYDSTTAAVVVDLTYYATQGPGAKLIGYPSNPDGPSGSTVEERGLAPRPSGPSLVRSAREIVVQLASGQRWLVWQWYQTGGDATGSAMELKLREGLRGLLGRGGSAAVSVAVACADACASGRERAVLTAFMADMQDALVAAADPSRPAKAPEHYGG
jgi:EpsI family protein